MPLRGGGAWSARGAASVPSFTPECTNEPLHAAAAGVAPTPQPPPSHPLHPNSSPWLITSPTPGRRAARAHGRPGRHLRVRAAPGPDFNPNVHGTQGKASGTVRLSGTSIPFPSHPHDILHHIPNQIPIAGLVAPSYQKGLQVHDNQESRLMDSGKGPESSEHPTTLLGPASRRRHAPIQPTTTCPALTPSHRIRYPEDLGRDGSRTPMPWVHDAPNAGFSLAPAPGGTAPRAPWLPIPPEHAARAVDVQAHCPQLPLHPTPTLNIFHPRKSLNVSTTRSTVASTTLHTPYEASCAAGCSTPTAANPVWAI